MVVVNIKGKEFYIDNTLNNQLDKVSDKVNVKDEDYFFAVDGEEGSGKSVLAMQLAKRLDPDFCIDRLVFTPKDFQDAIINAKKGQAVVFDEAFRGLSSRGALSEVNRLLVELMMECRQKNLFVIIVLPTFFLLDKYAALWRAKGLFHVYRNGGKRGYWMYFNKKKKKLLYLKGKATYSYDWPRSSFKGRFLEQYVLDEKEYREKKKKALQDSGKDTKTKVFKHQRDFLMWYLNREVGKTTTEISRFLGTFGITLSQKQVSTVIVRVEADLKKNGFLM